MIRWMVRWIVQWIIQTRIESGPSDIYDEVEENLRARRLDAQCLGGGRIRHDPGQKYIKVYGYSMGKENLPLD